MSDTSMGQYEQQYEPNVQSVGESMADRFDRLLAYARERDYAICIMPSFVSMCEMNEINKQRSIKRITHQELSQMLESGA